MNQVGIIVSIVSIIGFLALVLRHSSIRSLDARQALKLAVIWAAIIVGLVVVLQVSGLQIPS